MDTRENIREVYEDVHKLGRISGRIIYDEFDALKTIWDEFTPEYNKAKIENREEMVALLYSVHGRDITALAEIIVIMSYKLKCSRYHLLEAIKQDIENNY